LCNNKERVDLRATPKLFGIASWVAVGKDISDPNDGTCTGQKIFARFFFVSEKLFFRPSNAHHEKKLTTTSCRCT
jgi:hypothetical protein